MKLEDILIDEDVSIVQAAEQLEKIRCKILYIVKNDKLLASVSDGDIRRYVIRDEGAEKSVREIANYDPIYLNKYEAQKIEGIFAQSEVYSVPIVNYNHEIEEIVFRNGKKVKRLYDLNIPVVMMAGGKGTRLYPYTKILPKALIPIGDLPISERIFSNFYDFGCRHFYMILNHKANMIKAYYDGKDDKKYLISYIEENKELGTGGGLSLLSGQISTTFFMTNCDIIIDADYAEIYSEHKRQKNFITIVAAMYKNIVPYGVINCSENNDYISMIEKPELNYLINTGLYLIEPEFIEEIPSGENCSLPELIDKVSKMGHKVGVYKIDETAYMDMGQMEELEKMKEKLNVREIL